MRQAPFGFALHGGAGIDHDRDYHAEVAHLRAVAEATRARLAAGAAALEVVTLAVAALEASGLYIAGRGASPNDDGRFELDACVMDGATGRAGAVAALEGYQSPVAVARAVMERTPHVLLAGAGAAEFARREGFAPVNDALAWYTRALASEHVAPPAAAAHGTVGCVARDATGRLAAATSTGGVFGKLHGRVGDTPLIGASTWADERVAISSTGQGEYFIRAAAAAQVAFRMRFGGETLDGATRATLADIRARGGYGGLIAVDAAGDVSAPFTADGMKHAYLGRDGALHVAYR
jgi:L-asparaginase/beta-aspartyl-peptidase (threonine type)